MTVLIVGDARVKFGFYGGREGKGEKEEREEVVCICLISIGNEWKTQHSFHENRH